MDSTTQLCDGEVFVGDELVMRFEPSMDEGSQQQTVQQITTISDPEIVDATALIRSKNKESKVANNNEKKTLWFKIVSILGVIFTAIIGLPKDTKKMIAKAIIDNLDKKNEEKKRRLSETVSSIETT